MDTKNNLIEVLEEIQRRHKKNNLLSGLHVGQKRILDAMNKSRFVSIRSPRRWGKSTGLLRIGMDMADKMNCRCLYLAMYRTNAKSIAWQIAQELNENLGWTTNLVELALRGPGNRELLIMGADRPDLARLLRGWKNCVVIVDEAQSWSIDLEDLCNSILRHTLTDMRGHLLIAGTPGWDEQSFFARISNSQMPGWEAVVGEPLENPWTAVQQKEEMDEILKNNPDAYKEPWWQREYEGRWVADNRNLVYPFNTNNILYNWENTNKIRILGIDWGSAAESAFVVGEFDTSIDNKLTFVDAFEQPNMSLENYVNVINDLKQRWSPIITVADPGGTNKALTDELAVRCHLPIINADKTDKEAAIASMVRDMSLGMIQVASPQSEVLLSCWRQLVWDRKLDGTREERGKNHLSDTALYVRRAAWNYTHVPKPPQETEEQIMKRRIIEQHEKRMKQINRYGGG